MRTRITRIERIAKEMAKGIRELNRMVDFDSPNGTITVTKPKVYV